MADALAIMESLTCGRILSDQAVVLLMYEARWPEDAAMRGVYGRRSMQATKLQPMSAPEPCGCEGEAADDEPSTGGTVADLAAALQRQVEDVAAAVVGLKAETAMTDETAP